MEDLLATFMPKFAAIAKTRIARSIELATVRSPDGIPAIARELHAIAGEAGLSDSARSSRSLAPARNT